ncbi:phosphotransferase [Candidatus Woesearchaeota archaeon]|nr:phosphotransferase [Candidatus Woesearchaeota archaeon]
MIINLPFSCNNACSNCPGDRCFTEDWISEELRKDPKTFFIVGGEPTIQQAVPLCELAEKLVQDVPDCKIVLCTNGRTLAYKSVAKSLIQAGISNFVIFLRHTDKKKNDELSGADEGFEQTIHAIEHLTRYPIGVKIQPFEETDKEETEKLLNKLNKNAEQYGRRFTASKNDNLTELTNQDGKESSKNIPNSIVHAIEDQHKIKIDKLVPVWSGNYNLIYLATSGKDKLFVKMVCTHKEKNRKQLVEFEEELIRFLNENKIRTSKIINTANDAPSFLFEKTPVILYEFIEGKTLGKRMGHIDDAFSTLIKFHKAIKRFGKIPIGDLIEKTKKNVKTAEEILKTESTLKAKPAIKEKEEELHRIINKIKETSEKTLPKIPDTILHGDCRAENSIIRDGEAHILDFQNSFKGPAIYDLVIFCVSFIPQENFIQESTQLLDRFCKELDLSEAEKAAFPELLQIYLLKTLTQRCGEYTGEDKKNTEWVFEMFDIAEKMCSLPDSD